MRQSPGPSADESFTPAVSVRQCLPAWLTDAPLGSTAPEKLEENGLKMCQLQGDQGASFSFLSSFSPLKKRAEVLKGETQEQRLFLPTHRESPLLQHQTHTPGSPPSLALLCRVVSDTYTPAEGGRKGNNHNESQ